MKLVYPAVFYKHETGEGYTVEFPDLPGCVTQGNTIEEALEMAEDAASGWILISIEDGEEIPSPSVGLDITLYEGATFVNLIKLDMEEYAKQYGDKAVKKTLTIPRWLNTLAEKENINYSQVLQKALKKELKLDYAVSYDTSYIAYESDAANLIERIKQILPKTEHSVTGVTTSTEKEFVTYVHPWNLQKAVQ